MEATTTQEVPDSSMPTSLVCSCVFLFLVLFFVCLFVSVRASQTHQD